ncbi:MAG: sugar phosphate nucleotidyltransferase [Myxococcota bacterium]|nr:sugar phosphate nucleotidyltransferase [Myxococcota bacterium]
MNFIGLAAGKGSRMGQLGRYLQKSMYPVLDKPFLQYTLDALCQSSVYRRERDRIILVVGHYKDQIIEYFGTNYRGNRIDYVVQDKALGTGHAVWLAHQKSDASEPTIVWHGDNFVSTELFEAIVSNPYSNCITVTNYQSKRDLKERVDLGEERVLRVWRGTGPCIETGPWKFSSSVVEKMASATEDEYRALLNLQKMMDKGLEVGYIRNPNWIHLGGTEPTVPENIFACVQAMYQQEFCK